VAERRRQRGPLHPLERAFSQGGPGARNQRARVQEVYRGGERHAQIRGRLLQYVGTSVVARLGGARNRAHVVEGGLPAAARRGPSHDAAPAGVGFDATPSAAAARFPSFRHDRDVAYLRGEAVGAAKNVAVDD
jgi:hypothetical protein